MLEVPITVSNGRTVFLPFSRSKSASFSALSNGSRNRSSAYFDSLFLDVQAKRASKSSNVHIYKPKAMRDANKNVTAIPETVNGHETELWTEKYRASSYMDLVSDPGVNRLVVQWFVTWRNYMLSSSSSSSSKNHINHFNEIMTDADGRPRHKILIINGPPGTGKTTLAHVAANHANFKVFEVNASDEKSAEDLSLKLENLFGNSLLDSKSKGVHEQQRCLLLDEADGLDKLFLSNVLGTILNNNANSSLSSQIGEMAFKRTMVKKKLKRSKKRGGSFKDMKITRPIVLICNDFYGNSALKQLKEYSMFINLSKPIKSNDEVDLKNQTLQYHAGALESEQAKIIKRLRCICALEKVFFGENGSSDVECLVYLGNFFEWDVRLIVNALQSLKQHCLLSDLYFLNLVDVVSVCQKFFKDEKKNLFQIMDLLFSSTPTKGGMELISENVSEIKIILAGLEENTLHALFSDPRFEMTFKLFDIFSSVDYLMNDAYDLEKYSPLVGLWLTKCIKIERKPRVFNFPKSFVSLNGLKKEYKTLLDDILQITNFASALSLLPELSLLSRILFKKLFTKKNGSLADIGEIYTRMKLIPELRQIGQGEHNQIIESKEIVKMDPLLTTSKQDPKRTFFDKKMLEQSKKSKIEFSSLSSTQNSSCLKMAFTYKSGFSNHIKQNISINDFM